MMNQYETKNKENARGFWKNMSIGMLLKLITGGGCALSFLMIVLLESVGLMNGVSKQIGEMIYFGFGIAALVLGGGAVRTLKMAAAAFKWGYMLVPFIFTDWVIGICAGGFVLGAGCLLPFIPVALEIISSLGKE